MLSSGALIPEPETFIGNPNAATDQHRSRQLEMTGDTNVALDGHCRGGCCAMCIPGQMKATNSEHCTRTGFISLSASIADMGGRLIATDRTQCSEFIQ